MNVVKSSTFLRQYRQVVAYYSDVGGLELVKKFRQELNRKLDFLEQFPMAGPVGSLEDTREILLDVFPYRLMYRIDQENDRIVLLFIKHQARLP